MKRLLLVLALVACKDKAPGSSERAEMLKLPVVEVVPGKRATIPKTSPKVGEVTTRTRTMQITGLATSGGRFTIDQREVRLIEVVEVEGDVVTSARISYPEETFEKRTDGKLEPWTPLLRGHTYDVSWRDNRLLVISREGITPEEDERVRNDIAGELGPSDQVFLSFIGVPLESGRAIPLSTKAIAEQFNGAATITSAEARLTNVNGDIAVIEVAYRGTTQDLAFESRELSNWSIATGRQLSTGATAVFHSEQFANRVFGAAKYTYR